MDFTVAVIVGAAFAIAVVAILLGIVAVYRVDHRAQTQAAADERNRRTRLQDVADSDPMPWTPDHYGITTRFHGVHRGMPGPARRRDPRGPVE